MLKKLIAGTGLLLITALPLAAQAQAEKDHPLEAPTDENPQYLERKNKNQERRDEIGRDPKFPAHNKKPGAVDTTAKSTPPPGPVPPAKKAADTASPK